MTNEEIQAKAAEMGHKLSPMVEEVSIGRASIVACYSTQCLLCGRVVQGFRRVAPDGNIDYERVFGLPFITLCAGRSDGRIDLHLLPDAET